MAADPNAAAGGRQKTGNHFHGGGFAGAVGPEETQHLATLHGKGDIRYGNEGAEMPAQIINFNHCVHKLSLTSLVSRVHLSCDEYWTTEQNEHDGTNAAYPCR